MSEYKIKQEDVKDSAKLLQIKMKELRIKIIDMLNNCDRDFDQLSELIDKYIKTFKTNDYLLGYAEIEKEKE